MQVERVVPNALEPIEDMRFHQLQREHISVPKLWAADMNG
jgi:hypothetical protein